MWVLKGIFVVQKVKEVFVVASRYVPHSIKEECICVCLLHFVFAAAAAAALQLVMPPQQRSALEL